jgi:hypothetical protein
LIVRGNKESPERVVAAKDASDLALDMKRHNVIAIIERFLTQHALQEEREMKNLPAPPNGPLISGASDKNGIPPKSIFENEQVRVSTTSVPKGTDWSPPHDGRDRVVVLLDKINQVTETNEKDSFFSSAWRLTWVPANSDVNATNKSDQTKNLLILEFKDTAAEQALVRTEAPRSTKASQDYDPDHLQLGRLAVRLRS